MKSLIQENKVCYLCGSTKDLHVHHIFNGRSYRDKSEKDGMKIYLCPLCHYKVHTNSKKHKENTLLVDLKVKGQMIWEGLYGNREAFIKRYGKSYL